MMLSWLTGLVPMRAILLDMERRGLTTPTLVIHGSPTDAERPYHAEMVEMAGRCLWLTYVPVGLGQPETTFDDMLAALPGALTAAFANITPETLHPMLCGLRALVLPARALLMETYGFDRKQVFKETYD
jgi:ferredoxin-NADP reductase